ncbi:PASTA domain-containing protein [Candidatus Latescibacterota bacterium]
MNTTNKQNKKTQQKSYLAIVRLVALFLAKHLLLAGSAFTIAGIIFVVVSNWLVMPYYQKTGIEVRTPTVEGKTLREAQKLANQSSLSVAVDSLEYHNTVPADIISFQYPPYGKLIKPQRSIHVTISKGPKPFSIPNVIGMSQKNAELALKDAGLEVGEPFMIPSNRYTRGIVAGQDPEGGGEVPQNTRVILYISNGQPETNMKMPNLIELSLSAARDSLKSFNYNFDFLEIHYEDATELLPETVVDQHPDPGTLTNTNSVITLDVSKAK